jgi:hypothetical protein
MARQSIKFELNYMMLISAINPKERRMQDETKRNVYNSGGFSGPGGGLWTGYDKQR